MNFRLALAAAYSGKKIKLPEWEGWWFVGEDNLLYVHTKEGVIDNSPWFDKFVNREDWQVIDD